MDADVSQCDSRGAGEILVGNLVEREISMERLPHNVQVDVERLESRHAVGGVELDVYSAGGAARDRQRFVYRHTRGVYANDRGPAQHDVVQPEQLHGSFGVHCVGRPSRTGVLDHTDLRVGKQHAGCQRVQFAAFELGRALAEEYCEIIAGERESVALVDEAHVAFDGYEVADGQRQIGDRDREDIAFAFAEADNDRLAAEDNCFVDRPTGIVNSDYNVPFAGDRTDSRLSLAAQNTSKPAIGNDESAPAVREHPFPKVLITQVDQDVRRGDSGNRGPVGRRALVEQEIALYHDSCAADLEFNVGAKGYDPDERSGRKVEFNRQVSPELVNHDEGLPDRRRDAVELDLN